MYCLLSLISSTENMLIYSTVPLLCGHTISSEQSSLDLMTFKSRVMEVSVRHRTNKW